MAALGIYSTGPTNTATTTWTTSSNTIYISESSPEASKKTPVDPKIVIKAEKKRLREKKKVGSYVGKFLLLTPESGSNTELESVPQLCLKEAGDAVFCVSGDPEKPASKLDKFNLSRCVSGHHLVIEVIEDSGLLNQLADGYIKFLELEDPNLAEYRKVRFIAKMVSRLAKVELPEKALIINPMLPCIYNGEIILSRKMQATIRSQFCADYQKKATACFKEYTKEMLYLLSMVIQAQNPAQSLECIGICISQASSIEHEEKKEIGYEARD